MGSPARGIHCSRGAYHACISYSSSRRLYDYSVDYTLRAMYLVQHSRVDSSSLQQQFIAVNLTYLIAHCHIILVRGQQNKKGVDDHVLHVMTTKPEQNSKPGYQDGSQFHDLLTVRLYKLTNTKTRHVSLATKAIPGLHGVALVYSEHTRVVHISTYHTPGVTYSSMVTAVCRVRTHTDTNNVGTRNNRSKKTIPHINAALLDNLYEHSSSSHLILATRSKRQQQH